MSSIKTRNRTGVKQGQINRNPPKDQRRINAKCIEGLRSYWDGRDVSFWEERDTSGMWVIKSDLINGVPQRKEQ